MPARPGARSRASAALIWAALLTLVLYFVPYVQLLAWPLLLLSTLIHELGHGLGALALGGHFDKLLLYADGSGVAYSYGSYGAAGHALVAAAGLIGPPLAAAGLFAAGRRDRAARVALGLFAALCAV